MVVYLRKEGLKKPMWYYRLSINGKRYNRPVQEATCQRDAEKAEAVFKANLLQGKYDLADGKGEMPFSALVAEYEAYAKSTKKSWKTEACRVKNLSDFFGNKKLREITPILIERYRAERRKTPKVRQKKQEDGETPKPPKTVTNASVNREVSILRKMFSIAVENEWLDRNPCLAKKVKPLREDSRRERFLQPHEEKALLVQCVKKYAHLKPIIVCALHTGMRRGEILGLRWDWVDLAGGCITVTQTKSGKDRKIPISPTLKAHLEELSASRVSDYVFANPVTGEPYVDFKNSFATVLEDAKITGLRFHDLRHTAATRMVNAGIDLIVVQDILGHASITTTQRYSHPVPARKLDAVMALDGYVAENTPVDNVVPIAAGQA